MNPNPVLRKLGFADDDRVVIIHVDDIGLHQFNLAAFIDLVDFGLVSCGSVMVPCPWFPQVAAYYREHPELDLGVHLTLTSERDEYRWGPISTRDPASGLIDEEGYFYKRPPLMYPHADSVAVQRELQAQIDRALAAGIDATHLDSHQFALFRSRFVSIYIDLALQYHLPLMFLHKDEAGWREMQEYMNLDNEAASTALPFVEQLKNRGVPLFDHMFMMPLDANPSDRVEMAKQVLDSFPPGLTCLLIHPSKDTPGLRAVSPYWRTQVAEYEAFTSHELRTHIQNSGIQIIGYRALRNVLRGEE